MLHNTLHSRIVLQLTTRDSTALGAGLVTPPASSQKRMARDRNSQQVTRLVWKVHSHSRKVCRAGQSGVKGWVSTHTGV